jgi:hypothetical protein
MFPHIYETGKDVSIFPHIYEIGKDVSTFFMMYVIIQFEKGIILLRGKLA